MHLEGCKKLNMNFDDEARDWDNDPKKTERAIIFAKEINDFIKPEKTLNALEFGCGTGLLSFQLKDYFNTITLADNSEGMIKVLQNKIVKEGVKNFKRLHIASLESDLKLNEYDVIYTLMTLHHIPDVNNIVKIFNSILKRGGYLCVADLVKEDGSFHSHHDNFDGHNGFDRNELSVILSNNGFNVEYYKICFEIEKEMDDMIKKYPLFIMICKKIT
ncbi:MAG: class I SAM-dependent methyltransferase [Ignavibacteriaceae bacterium]|jgi:2-polyprenyl-3-methyl-5-hydroxy-6-metoxy-1,4-benzoquinol methylase